MNGQIQTHLEKIKKVFPYEITRIKIYDDGDDFLVVGVNSDFCFEDHVFFDRSRLRVSGVIDFADVTIDDPAHDFQNIIEYGGEAFFRTVMEYYQLNDDPTLLLRTKLRLQTRPLFEAAYSLMFGFHERFMERLAYITTSF